MESLIEELRALREQQEACLKQQEVIAERLTALEKVIPGHAQLRSGDTVESSQTEIFKMKVDEMEKQLKKKQHEIHHLEKKCDTFQNNIFHSFEHMTGQLHSELGYVKETCVNLGHTIQNVKEDFDKTWLSSPLKVKECKEKIKQKFQETDHAVMKYLTNVENRKTKLHSEDVNKYREDTIPKTEYFSLSFLENENKKFGQHNRKVGQLKSCGKDELNMGFDESMPSPLTGTPQCTHLVDGTNSDLCPVNDLDACSNSSSSDGDTSETTQDLTALVPHQMTMEAENKRTEAGGQIGLAGTDITALREMVQGTTFSALSKQFREHKMVFPGSQEKEQDVGEMLPDVLKFLKMDSLESMHSSGGLPDLFSGKVKHDCISLLIDNGIPLNDSNVKKIYDVVVRPDDMYPSPRCRGLDTMLILDVSESMAGAPLEQMKQIVFDFLDGLVSQRINKNVEENVGLVTMGRETKIHCHFTNDFSRIKDCVARLEAGGKTPLIMALLIALQGIEVDGKRIFLRHGRYVICPRVILITDGQVNTSHECEGRDEFEQLDYIDKQMQLQGRIFNLLEKFRNDRYSIHAIGVGNYEKEFLTALSELTGGKLYGPDQVKTLYRYHQYQCVAGGIRRKSETGARGIIEHLFEPSEVDEIISIARKMDETDRLYPVYRDGDEEDNPRLLCIGSRVRRGPDWKNHDEDSNGVGTVTGHFFGQLCVRWDNNYKGLYSYGDGGEYEVLVTDEARILKEDELIEVGVKVRRGPDWHYGNQDGVPGSVGVVWKKTKNQVQVRWPNGYKDIYNYGRNGLDLEIVNDSELTGSLGKRSLDGKPSENIFPVESSRIQWSDETLTESMTEPGHKLTDRKPSNMQTDRMLPDGSELRDDDVPENLKSSMSPGVLWQWQDNDQTWQAYTPDTMKRIEREYSKNAKGGAKVLFNIDGKSVEFDIIFERMIQKESYGENVHRVRRFVHR